MKIDKTFKLQFQNDDFGYLDAFGLESEHIFAPYKDIELPDVPSDITLVVGESGSGCIRNFKIQLQLLFISISFVGRLP